MLPLTTRRRALGLATVVAPLLARPGLAQPRDSFPSRPITLIVPFPAGGTSDVVMRAIAEAAARRLPQPIVVENRPGAAGTLGAQTVARARPDGYTLTQLAVSAVRNALLTRLSFDTLRDFTPVLNIAGFTFGCLVRADSFPGGWPEFVEAARRRPGAISVGNPGVNGTLHTTMVDLGLRERIELNHVPFRGDADGAQALVGGHIDAMAVAAAMGSLVDGGQARWLHVWTRERLRRWPNAPTLLELGYQDMAVTSPYGIVAPAGLDPAVLRVLHNAFAAAVQDPAHLATLARFDMAPEYLDSERYAAFLRTLIPQEMDLIRRLNLQAG